ncbi:Ig-like domain-containing protein, partial [Bifidobacterium adolescentis]|uniref:Ig-like domain-containing protein n=1 Tax=Bifidobacterium adolescentis TaxID=1680 RepID=UPI001E3F929D
MKKIPVLACSSVAILALGLSIALPSGFAQNVENTTNQSVQTISENTIHSETASSGPVTLKASWDETKLGSPTTFHVEATGGSGKYMFRMDAPSYSSPDEYAFESVADPSRSDWTKYTSETTSHDYEFTMMASGTYNFHFYVMDKTAGVYYLRVNFNIQVSDPNYPSINEIVSEAVAQSEKETDGTEYAKAVWLHDWLIGRMEYDSTLKWSSAESALSRGLGTCQSYESAYSKLLTKAGIENVETRDTKDAHTWNAVKIDGDWYQIDATWDDSNDNWYGFDQRHLYFGLTDELMTIAHPGHESMYQTEGYAQRSTSLKDNYYVRSGEADQWADKYAERIQKHLDALDKTFTVDVDNANDPPSIRNIVNGIITYAIGQKNWNADGRDVALTVKVNDKVFEFTAQYADIPVESVSISGDGVKDGKLKLESGASAQLTATVSPSNATDRKVTWTSSDSSVANVMGTGVVT